MDAGPIGRTIGAPQYVEPQRDDYVYQVALRRGARTLLGRVLLWGWVGERGGLRRRRKPHLQRFGLRLPIAAWRGGPRC